MRCARQRMRPQKKYSITLKKNSLTIFEECAMIIFVFKNCCKTHVFLVINDICYLYREHSYKSSSPTQIFVVYSDTPSIYSVWYNYRMIVLPATAFDSRVKFLQEVRANFGAAILNLGGSVTTSTLADYYACLKDDVAGPDKTYHKAQSLGSQKDGYWLLSKEVIKSSKMIIKNIQW